MTTKQSSAEKRGRPKGSKNKSSRVAKHDQPAKDFILRSSRGNSKDADAIKRDAINRAHAKMKLEAITSKTTPPSDAQRPVEKAGPSAKALIWMEPGMAQQHIDAITDKKLLVDYERQADSMGRFAVRNLLRIRVAEMDKS